jgi:hypothetical protein
MDVVLLFIAAAAPCRALTLRRQQQEALLGIPRRGGEQACQRGLELQ